MGCKESTAAKAADQCGSAPSTPITAKVASATVAKQHTLASRGRPGAPSLDTHTSVKTTGKKTDLSAGTARLANAFRRTASAPDFTGAAATNATPAGSGARTASYSPGASSAIASVRRGSAGSSGGGSASSGGGGGGAAAAGSGWRRASGQRMTLHEMLQAKEREEREALRRRTEEAQRREALEARRGLLVYEFEWERVGIPPEALPAQAELGDVLLADGTPATATPVATPTTTAGGAAPSLAAEDETDEERPRMALVEHWVPFGGCDEEDEDDGCREGGEERTVAEAATPSPPVTTLGRSQNLRLIAPPEDGAAPLPDFSATRRLCEAVRRRRSSSAGSSRSMRSSRSASCTDVAELDASIRSSADAGDGGPPSEPPEGPGADAEQQPEADPQVALLELSWSARDKRFVYLGRGFRADAPEATEIVRPLLRRRDERNVDGGEAARVGSPASPRPTGCGGGGGGGAPLSSSQVDLLASSLSGRRRNVGFLTAKAPPAST